MENLNLYLFKTEKDKRTRIEIAIDNFLATAIMVTCYNPTAATSSYSWDIKTLNWHFEDVAQWQAYLEFISGYRKEEKKFFKIALADALQYKRHTSKQKQHLNPVKLKQAERVNYQPMLTREEVLLKILRSKGKC